MKPKLFILSFFLVIISISTRAQMWQWIKPVPPFVPRWSEIDSRGCQVIMSLNNGSHLLTKHDAFGDLIWSKAIYPVTQNVPVTGDILSLTLDSYDNIYFITKPIASFNGTPVNTPGPCSLVKLDPMGRYLWSKQVDISSNTNFPINTASAKNGLFFSIALVGGTNMTYQGQTFSSYSPSVGTTVIMSLDTAGNIRWANRLGSFRPDNTCPQVNAVPVIKVNEHGRILLHGQTGKTLMYNSDVLLDRPECTIGLYATMWNSDDGSVRWVKQLHFDSLAAQSGYTLGTDRIQSAVLPNGNSLLYKFSGNYNISSGEVNYINALSKFYVFDTLGNLINNKLLSASNKWYRLGSTNTTSIAINEHSEIFTIGTSVAFSPFHKELLEIRKYDQNFDTIWTRKGDYNSSIRDFDGWMMSYKNNNIACILQSSANLPYPYYAYFGTDSLVPARNSVYHVKLTDRAPDSINSVAGKVYFDENLNGVFDAGEMQPAGILIGNENPAAVYGGTTHNGKYKFLTGTGTYNFMPVNIEESYPNHTVAVPAQRTLTLNGNGVTVLNQDFALRAPVPVNDGSISVTPMFIPRPGRNVAARVIVKNIGTSNFNGTYNIIFDPLKLDFVTSSKPLSSSTSNSLIFNFSTITPFDTLMNDIVFAVKPTVQLGDTVRSFAYLQTNPADDVPVNNSDSMRMIIQTSYDPNEKQVYPPKHLNYEQTAAGNTRLDYKLYFQNTGTDTAFMVSVKDTLDQDIDIRTFELVSSSHPVNVIWHRPNIIEFYFPGIRLPQESVNEPGSHGFVRFKIKPKASMQPADTIYNSCSIYFDYNSPVNTNIVENFFPLSVVPVTLIDFNGRINGEAIDLQWSTSNEIALAKFELECATALNNFKSMAILPVHNTNGVHNYIYTDEYPSGPVLYYRLKMVDVNGSVTYSKIISFRFSKASWLNVGMARAATGSLQLQISSSKNTPATIQVSDITGRIILNHKLQLSKGINTVSLNNKLLSAGLYTASVIAGDEKVSKFITAQ